VRVSDEQIMVALLNSPTQKQAAAMLGVTEQTLCKRVQKSDFQKRFSELRRKMLDTVSSELTKASYAAANKLVENIKLLTDKNIVSCEIYDTGSIKKNKFWVWYRKEDDSIQKVDFQNIALRVNEMYKVPELEWDAGQLFINLSEHQYQEWN